MLAVLAVMNGVTRNAIYSPVVGEKLAHQISTITLSIIFLGAIYLFFSKTNSVYAHTDLWIIGLCWFTATIMFEFIFGHYVFGNSWEKLFTDYNLLEGRIWVIIPIVIFFGPWLVGRKNKTK